MDRKLEEYEVENLLSWLDNIPLSRPKRKLRRDFSDGVLTAEVIKHFFPKFIELTSVLLPSCSKEEKTRNWNLLNRKVFPKLDFHVPEDVIGRIVLSSPGAIEPVLITLREKIDHKLAESSRKKTNQYKFDFRNPETSQEELLHAEASILAELADLKIDKKKQKTMNEDHVVEACYKTRDPAVILQFLLKKDRAISDFLEVAKILQSKVEKLERLVQLRDVKIQTLTKKSSFYFE